MQVRFSRTKILLFRFFKLAHSYYWALHPHPPPHKTGGLIGPWVLNWSFLEYLLNPKSIGHKTRPTDKYSHGQHIWGIF